MLSGQKVEQIPLAYQRVSFLAQPTLEKKTLTTTLLLVFVCLFGFYGMSTSIGYLMPNPSLYK